MDAAAAAAIADLQALVAAAIAAAMAAHVAQPPVPLPAADPLAPVLPDAALHHVAVKLPDFWTKDPDMWFAQAECGFEMARVTRSYTKYQHVLMKLPQEVIISVRSLVQEIEPTTPDAYEQLKARLSTSFSMTPYQRGYAILDHPDLGDRRPSRMMAEMVALLPAGSAPDILFFCLFLRRLPASIREHLAAAAHKHADEMAAHADRLWDARQGSAGVSTLVEPLEVLALRQTGRGGSQSPSRSRRASPDTRKSRDQSRPRRSTPSRRGDRSDYVNPSFCFYHDRFGKKASKCENPCTWTKN